MKISSQLANNFDYCSAEIGEFFNQELFTPRPEPALSGVEGRLRRSAGSLCPEPAEGRGAISESYFTGMPEVPKKERVRMRGA